jgi:hypothetical protein
MAPCALDSSASVVKMCSILHACQRKLSFQWEMEFGYQIDETIEIPLTKELFHTLGNLKKIFLA